MKTLLIGIGAAGNKATLEATKLGVVKPEDAIIINSTTKDFPDDFTGTELTLSPKDAGCGKERSVAKEFAVNFIKSGKLNSIDASKYTTVIIATSVEGGTGSGSTPIIAKYFNQVQRRNVHIVAFTGFEDDVRGLRNTIEFFQEVDSNLIIHAISNAAFLRIAGGNKFKAEELANKEMCRRIEVLTGQKFVNSKQNIDDTDILKVSNTSGYMTVEYSEVDKPMIDQDDFNRYIKRMIYDSKSLKSDHPGAKRIGIILNIAPESEDAIDYSYQDIIDEYGKPYELFTQSQWDEQKEYIAFIVSGMQLPLERMKEVFDRYQEESQQVNNTADAFYKELANMNLSAEDSKFDMIKPAQKGVSTDDFLSHLNDEPTLNFQNGGASGNNSNRVNNKKK